MPCCGRKRAKLTSPDAPREPGDKHTYFQYVGKTSMLVRGPRSRSLYRFDEPGRVLAVDDRDIESVSAVPKLVMVKTPPTTQTGS